MFETTQYSSLLVSVFAPGAMYSIYSGIIKGFEFPTTTTFLRPNGILVLEKEKGTVQFVSPSSRSHIN